MGWLPLGQLNPSVVYSSYLEKGEPTVPGRNSNKKIYTKTYTWTHPEDSLKSSINAIVVGHQPVGDAPLSLIVDGEDSAEPLLVSFPYLVFQLVPFFKCLITIF